MKSAPRKEPGSGGLRPDWVWVCIGVLLRGVVTVQYDYSILSQLSRISNAFVRSDDWFHMFHRDILDNASTGNLSSSKNIDVRH